ncbi:MAG: pyridoxamine 5'-phosphate oxidase family protein [Mycobacterium sp.]|uniref:pyridoxamine 5'-phosphate oxidase family protein n=1 Tax=Mycobacterium sp. TaxID=1785 RepID=UPI003F98BF27
MITRDVEASALGDLALSPPRAALAVTVDDEIRVLPVSVNLEGPGDPASSPRIVQVPEGSPDLADRNVVVIADDGPEWFRLRSLTVRGIAKAVGDCTYRVVPKRIVAWDYGSLRRVPTLPVTSTPRRASFSVTDENDDVNPFRSPNLEAAVRSSRVMILASRSQRGTPFAVPLWFVRHHGRWYATTSASSWTVRNVAASPQVAILLGGEGRGNTNRLLVRGSARAVRGMPPPAVLARIAWLYYLQPRFAAVELGHIRLWALRMRYYGQSQAAYVVITPQTATELRAP